MAQEGAGTKETMGEMWASIICIIHTCSHWVIRAFKVDTDAVLALLASACAANC